jgi:hypothetical protein
MSLISAFVARDSEMILCEYNADSDLSLRKTIKSELKRTTTTPYTSTTLANSTSTIHFHYDTIFFGCITDTHFTPDKAQTFLSELSTDFKAFYKAPLDKLFSQTNLKNFILDKPYQSRFEKLFSEYDTGINRSLIDKANAKIDETKVIVGKTIDDMVESQENTQKLLEESEEMKVLGMEFQEDAKDFAEKVRKRNWWMCSKPCIATFLIGGGVTIGVILLCSFLI